MKDCVTVPTENETLPPNKRVNYNFGMVMDVDAFRQEQTHFEWKHALGNSLLHGYGTVCGLEVQSEPDGTDVKILVEPGYAISPSGKWIWVEEQLCALLDAWVQNNRDDSGGTFLAPGANRVYITLCYDECPTDLVPIAGRACASDEDTRAPSRILETVRAGFSWEPPEQIAEDAANWFGDILGAVEFTDDPTADESDLFLDLIMMLGEVTSPPFSSPQSPFGSPPGDGTITLWEETACDTIRQALVLWVTEVCPALHENPGDCILLGCVDFMVDIGGRVLPPSVEVDNCERPVLIPTRLQQELFCLLGGGGSGITVHANLQGLAADDHPQYFNQVRGDARYALLGHTHALDELQDVNAPGPAAGDFLAWIAAANEWQPAPLPPTAPHAHDLDDLGDVNAPGPAAGDFLAWIAAANEWQPAPLPPPAPHAHNLSDLGDVNASSPAGGEVLTWDAAANEWQPEQVDIEAGEADLTRIVALSWVHNRFNFLPIIHDGVREVGLAVAFGKRQPNDAGLVRASTLTDQVFQVFGEQLIGGGLALPTRLLPREIVPVDIVNLVNGRITETATSGAAFVSGVLFIFDPASLDNNLSSILRIVIHGDFIMDESAERAIDAEFVRAQLPTGDRPRGADRGIQGGRFESWLNRSLGVDNNFIDINRASAGILARLPGIGRVRAEAIIANRPFNRIDDLTRVTGISPDLVDDLRGLITIG